MFNREIAIIGAVGTVVITFIITLLASTATNHAMTQFEEGVRPIVESSPQTEAVFESGKTLDEVDGVVNDVKNVQNAPTKGIKNMNFVYPFMVLVAGVVFIWKKYF